MSEATPDNPDIYEKETRHPGHVLADAIDALRVKATESDHQRRHLDHATQLLRGQRAVAEGVGGPGSYRPSGDSDFDPQTAVPRAVAVFFASEEGKSFVLSELRAYFETDDGKHALGAAVELELGVGTFDDKLAEKVAEYFAEGQDGHQQIVNQVCAESARLEEGIRAEVKDQLAAALPPKTDGADEGAGT
jgi:hypothetical protein